MISGARISLLIAVSVVLISGVAGTLLGAISGYWGGSRDVVVQKIVETFWAFPPILLALTIMAFFGQSLPNIILAIAVQRWIPYCRIARAQALVLANRDFVAAAQIMGGGTAWIVRRHILPNILSSAVVVATFSMATAILAEASLSFLGLGVPATIASWGGMLAEGRSYMVEAWWIAVFPGLGIVVTVLGLNLLGDWMRDRFDPKNMLKLR
jgi:peptide/nickel transport system permease protein